MTNRIEIKKLKSYLENGHGPQAAKQTKGRIATRRGKVLTVRPTQPPRPHTGGGRRKPQQGHSKRSERKLLHYLCTCKPSNFFVSFTFPRPTGPVEAKQAMGKFFRNLENNLPFEYGAVAKMELQPATMRAEFMVHIWVENGCSLEESLVQKHWDKVTGEPSHIEFRETKPELWTAVSDYMSKEVRVANDYVKIGSFTFSVKRNEKVFGSEEDSLYLVTSPQYRAKYNIPKEIKVSKSVFDSWRCFEGQYVMKHNPDFIPKDSDNDGDGCISEEMDLQLQSFINSTRKTFFLGKDDGYKIIMDDFPDNFFIESSKQLKDSGSAVLNKNISANDINAFVVSADDSDPGTSYVNPGDAGAVSKDSHSGLGKLLHYFRIAYNTVSFYCRKILCLYKKKE